MGKKFYRLLLTAAAVTATVWALVLPASSMEGQPVCGLEAHQHEDGCYTVVEILNCKAMAHSHAEGCYDSQGSLVCGYREYLLHSHGEGCFDTGEQLRCPFAEITGHTHGEDCYGLADSTLPTGETEALEPVLLCTQQEQSVHIHEETCFLDGTWTCGQWQLEEHSHGGACFETEAVLTCQLAEHAHIEDCYPEPETTAAVETAAAETTEATQESILLAAQEETIHTAAVREDDVLAVSGEGIRFRLFNYSLDINKTAAGDQWRDITPYFTFRNSRLTKGTLPAEGVYIPDPNINASHDADGFPATHATVERVLQGGMPVLDLTRNADGTARTDPGLSAQARSLAYLFSATGDHAVTAYSPGNTILQKSGNHYWYDSRSNAVDYDMEAGQFRLRGYAERNSTTAGYGSAYGDFLPFNYTGGETIHDPETEQTPYHLKTEDADYWFGMTMEVSFYQSREGLLGEENMVFRFSGDDDVWVFVDDVLVLDLGGTHGTVDGSIDFATGEILQYLSWGGANATEEARAEGSDISFPTTLWDCFEAAGRTPNGGWSEDGKTFADYTEHTLKFFYLERGAAVANCKIDFRLPTLPDKSLTVTKELTAEEPVADYLRTTLDYRFRVVKADAPEELFLTPGMSYTLLDNGVSAGTGTVKEDGTFSLKAGQSAQFADMLVKGGGCKSYVVQEIMPDALTGQYAGVEYTVSGTGGLTETEEGPTADFTAYETAVLSAEQTQVVTFRNRVDTSRLSSLQLTKLTAEGSSFTGEEAFLIQVKLGGQLLPVGTPYRIGETEYTVSQAGIVPLQSGQTAVLLTGILSGTSYEITELDTPGIHYRASYSGSVSPEGEVICTGNGASGEFPLGSTVQITVTNASYDFAVEIPLHKEVIRNDKTQTFFFRVFETSQEEDGSWNVGSEVPGTGITVTDSGSAEGKITIGLSAEATGTFYYRIQEEPGDGGYLYDSNFYIVQITAGDGTGAITGIWKNGTEPLPADTALSFLNHRTGTILVSKQVMGGDSQESFSFTAEITLEGEPFRMPAGEGYTVEENRIQFSLTHGQSLTLADIPRGAEIIITELCPAEYLPSYRVEGKMDAYTDGEQVQAALEQEQMIIRFVNRAAYELPKTGGAGTNLYTLGGLLQMAAAGSLLYYQKKRDRKAN